MRIHFLRRCSKTYAPILSLFILFSTHELASAQSQNWRWCAQQDKVALEQQIASCSALINSGAENRANLAAAITNRGNAYLRQGMLDLALADYNEAIRLNPRLSNAFNGRGLVHENKRNLIQARTDYTEAIRLDPKNVNALSNRGAILTILKEFDLAARDFSTAIAINPSNASTYVARGEAYLEKEDIESALKDTDTALRLDPNNADAFTIRARVWLAKREWDRSIETATVGIEKNPRSANLYATRGLAYRNKGEFDLSLMDYNESLRLFPSAGTYVNRALLHSSRGELDLALADLNEAIRLAPRMDAAYNNRANIHITRGEFHRALADLDVAIELNPKSANAFYNRGITRQKLGGINASTLASADFSAARAIDPKIDGKIEEQQRIERLAKQRYRFHQVAKLSPTQQAEQERRNSIVGLLFGIWLLVVAATVWLAKARGESALFWGALALPLNIIALLLLWLRRPRESRADIQSETNSRSATANVRSSVAPPQTATSQEGDWVWLANETSKSVASPPIESLEVSKVTTSNANSLNERLRDPSPDIVAETREHNGRTYRIFGDGRVEYDSPLGTKIFGNESDFKDFVGIAPSQIDHRARRVATGYLLAGLAAMGIGIALTVAGASAAQSRGGGQYLVFWGLVLFGFIQAIRGLSIMSNPELAPQPNPEFYTDQPQSQATAGKARAAGRTALGREFWILESGQVEYDSPSGRRIFKTEAEFREFIS